MSFRRTCMPAPSQHYFCAWIHILGLPYLCPCLSNESADFYFFEPYCILICFAHLHQVVLRVKFEEPWWEWAPIARYSADNLSRTARETKRSLSFSKQPTGSVKHIDDNERIADPDAWEHWNRLGQRKAKSAKEPIFFWNVIPSLAHGKQLLWARGRHLFSGRWQSVRGIAPIALRANTVKFEMLISSLISAIAPSSETGKPMSNVDYPTIILPFHNDTWKWDRE